jgi:hypothetical protein
VLPDEESASTEASDLFPGHGTQDHRPTFLKHENKLNMGVAHDDIHVCIMCLRAIMNNKYGFNMVIKHNEAINCLVLGLNHHRQGTKALVLELLSAICLVKGGHKIILDAFDNFKSVCSENHRFEILMHYFKNYQEFHIEFMVACMQFINIVVHSVEDMNFRVYLQYEFTQLGLDSYLEKIRYTESEELQVQIAAYLDNEFDVAALMEDSIARGAALEKVADMQDELARTNEELSHLENEHILKMVELETQLAEVRREKEELLQTKNSIAEEVSTLRRAVTQKEEESRQNRSLFEQQITEIEKNGGTGSTLLSNNALANSSGTSPVPPPPAPPPPPPPPPPSFGMPAPPPPPLPGFNQAPPGEHKLIYF